MTGSGGGSFDELLKRLPPDYDRLEFAADLLRHAMTGTEIVLLDTVIGLLTQGLAAGPADRARHLSNLCLAHRERHRCGGGPADLDRAVEIGEEAIAAATDGDPNRAAYLSNLGIALRERCSPTTAAISTAHLRVTPGRASNSISRSVSSTVPANDRAVSTRTRCRAGKASRSNRANRTSSFMAGIVPDHRPDTTEIPAGVRAG
jgi:hypothetical protein